MSLGAEKLQKATSARTRSTTTTTTTKKALIIINDLWPIYELSEQKTVDYHVFVCAFISTSIFLEAAHHQSQAPTSAPIFPYNRRTRFQSWPEQSGRRQDPMFI